MGLGVNGVLQQVFRGSALNLKQYGSSLEIIKRCLQENDKLRQHYLEQEGLQVIRFTNQEVLAHLETVIQKIFDELPVP